MITLYQALYESNGRGFRVNDSVGRSEGEAIEKASNHVSVKAGAELLYIDSWQVLPD